MTTFHTDLCEGLPAPAPFDPVHAPRPRGLDFDGATRALAICRDRERFHRWCGRFVNLSKAHSEDDWWFYYRIFVAQEDARDEYNERRHIDGHDEQLDPHLDAFV